MAKYRLLAKHYINDQLLEEGTIVGDETPHKLAEWGVTPDMEGLDDEAKAKVKEAIDKATQPLPASPQLGLLYLQPAVEEAILSLNRSAEAKKEPLPKVK